VDGDRILIVTNQRLSVVDGRFGAFNVRVSFRYPPLYSSSYTIVARSDKIAADKGLRRFIADAAARNEQNRK
jgi:hypothetical protein